MIETKRVYHLSGGHGQDGSIEFVSDFSSTVSLQQVSQHGLSAAQELIHIYREKEETHYLFAVDLCNLIHIQIPFNLTKCN